MSRFFMKTVAIAVAASHFQGAEARLGKTVSNQDSSAGSEPEKKTIPGKVWNVTKQMANSGPGRFVISFASTFLIAEECVDKFQGSLWRLFCGWKNLSNYEKIRGVACASGLGYCFKKGCISVHPKKFLAGTVEVASALRKLVAKPSLVTPTSTDSLVQKITGLLPAKYEGNAKTYIKENPVCVGTALGCCLGAGYGLCNGEMTIPLASINVK